MTYIECRMGDKGNHSLWVVSYHAGVWKVAVWGAYWGASIHGESGIMKWIGTPAKCPSCYVTGC